MSAFPAHPARFAGPLLAASLLGLAACTDKAAEKFGPPCPTTAILRDAADLHRYRGSGRDIIDNELDGRITAISGSCVRDGDSIVAATIAISMELVRGPVAGSRIADVAYFIAVLDGDRILEKRVYSLNPEFPPNTDRLRLTGESIELRVPVTPQKTAAAYRITVGFQLTPHELEINRERGGRR
jgi:hypothetical protein